MKERVYVRPGKESGVEVAESVLLSLLTVRAEKWRDTAMFRVPSFRVERVEVHRSKPDETISLRRSDRHWKLETPIKAPADDDKAEGLVAELSALRVAEGDSGFVEKGARDLVKYGLDKPSMTVEMTPFDGNDKSRQSIKIGAPVPGKPDEFYAMRGDQKDVVRVDAKRLFEAIPGANAMRSQKVLDFDPARVERVRVDARGKLFDLARTASGWKLLSPAESPADVASVQTLLMRLGELKASEFLDPKNVADPRLDPPHFRVRGWQAGRGEAATAGTPAEPKGEPGFDLAFGRVDALKKTVYGRIACDTTVMALPESILDVLPRNDYAYRERTVLSIKPEQFEEVTIERGHSLVTVRAPASTGSRQLHWTMVEPVEAPTDEAAVTALVLTLGNLRAESWESDALGDGHAFGLDAPALRVKWTLQGGASSAKGVSSGERKGVVRLGKQKPESDSFFANVEGDPRVFTLNAAVAKPFDAELHDPKILSVKPAEADRVVLRWPSRSLTLEKMTRGAGAPPLWVAAPGYDATGFDVNRTEALLSALSGLKTPKFLQYEGRLPDGSGLDRPRVSVTVRTSSSGKTAEHSLRVGNSLGRDAFAATTAEGHTGPVFVLPADAVKEIVQTPTRLDDLPDDPFVHVPKPPAPEARGAATMTTIEGVERFLKIRPFRPFNIRESSGVTHRVVSPESVKVLPKLNLIVVFPPDGDLVMLGADQVSAAFYRDRVPKKKPDA